MKPDIFSEVAADKGAGSQFEEAMRCMGVDLKPNLGTVKYDNFASRKAVRA